MLKILLGSFFLAFLAFANSKPVPNGPLKVYRGPEGELIGMVEVNQSKEMLVHFKNVGGELEGKSKVYLYSDNGRQGKEVYFNHQWRKSKTRPWVVLSSADGGWQFANPTKGNQSFSVSYSQSDTDKLKIEDVLKAYKP